MVPAKAIVDRLGIKEIFSKTARVNKAADYRQIVADRSEDGVAVIGIDGVLQFVNGTWASMHGYKGREELVGKNIRQFYIGRAMDDFNRFVAQTKLIGWYIATIEQSREDNSTFAVQLKMAILKDDAGKPNAVLLIAADLSRISQMQKMLQKTTEELEAIKARMCRLEESLARRNKPVINIPAENTESGHKQPILSVPVDELKQLAEMAKRFR